MCLMAFALGVVPGCPLILAANRDEHLDRPTQPLHVWPLANGTPVAAGRDLHAGGTWVGLTPQGRVAMLTNVREGQLGNAPLSRGELVTAWLQGDADWRDFARQLDADRYNGFNLVVGDLHSQGWVWMSNRPPPRTDDLPAETVGSLTVRALAPGVYGLSNAALDSPWPKTLQLKRAMHEVVTCSTSALAADWRKPLLASLLDRRQAPAEALPQTGAPRVWEQALSSPFVDYAERRYGTRSSLLVSVCGDEAQLEEWTHERPAAGAPAGGATRWPLAHSTYRRVCISMCGMPASSNGSPVTV